MRNMAHAGTPSPPPAGGAWGRVLNSEAALAALFLLPSALVLLGVVIYPFVSAIWISFHDKYVGQAGRFIGLGNSGHQGQQCQQSR